MNRIGIQSTPYCTGRYHQCSIFSLQLVFSPSPGPAPNQTRQVHFVKVIVACNVIFSLANKRQNVPPVKPSAVYGKALASQDPLRCAAARH